MTEPQPEEWAHPEYSGWATVTDAREHWSDARTMGDAELERLLQAAYEQCAAFAPSITGNLVPESYVLAQVLQARALYRSAQATGQQPTDPAFGGEFAVTVFPMDWTVKNLLRPQTGRYLVR